MMLSLLAQYEQSRDRYLDTDKEDPNHAYISKFYNIEFERFKDKKINLLEIGCASGGSLLMWHDYFQQATIYGVDSGQDSRFENCKIITKSVDRIQLHQIDAYNKDFVTTLPNFDIIIDDGPHTKESHFQLLDLYLPKLNQGGVLVIEDLNDINYGKEYCQKLTSEYQYETLDTNTEKEYNSILFVVRKL